MKVRTYGRRSRSMTRSNSGSGFDEGVSDSQESPQDVYNFTISSQDSTYWAADHYSLINSSSQDNDQLAILPPRNGRANGGFEGFDGDFWKSSKKVKIGDSEPFTLNSSQESDELAILPSERNKEAKGFGYPNGVYGKLKDSEPCCLNSSQESDDLAILSVKGCKENGRVDGVLRKSKKMKENGVLPKKKKKVKSSEVGSGWVAVNPTKTLMETQEFGEMMEHVDEVNFALDGLKKGQPVSIRRASLLSLLSICGTAQQRRLLRAHGLAKTIIDAILGLSYDDSPSNLAAAALFYILTGDGQDDYLLDSPSCIHFLIKLVKPLTSDTAKSKASTLGSKLLAIRIDADASQDSTRGSNSSTAAIMLKVQEVLISCKDLKPRDGNDDPAGRPELNPKWISLLTMEKACLSTISIEDNTGRVRKSGGNFKEKLRELGGLNAVFEVARNCHFTLERWLEQGSSSVSESKDNGGLESLVLLLKCMKIMENATFLSKENQSHLLGMKGNFDGEHAPRTFTKLILSVIRILSGISLLQSSAGRSREEKTCNHSSEMSQAAAYKIDDHEMFITSSSRCSVIEGTSSQKSSSICQNDQWLTSGLPRFSKSNSETTTTSVVDPWLKMRIDSSTSGSCSGTSGNTSNRLIFSNRGSEKKFAISNNCKSLDDSNFGLVEDSQDPFAFDEDDFEPSKWDLLSGGHKVSRTQNTRVEISDRKNICQSLLLMGQEEPEKENHHSSEVSCSSVLDEEKSNLLADCLLSSVKALMNLTNDNTVGCQQIAACGGLEILSSLIAGHFPKFTSYLPSFSNSRENSTSSRSSIEVENQNDVHLTDQELDLLVAILGLLVNLVEKDGPNRSQLAASSVSLPSLEGLEEGSDTNIIPLLCSIFLANQGAGEGAEEGLSMDDEDALLQGEKEAEKMIVEAYSALLLAFLSTESRSIRNAIAECLPDHNLAILVPVLERFVEFHLSLNMISPETHTTVLEVIESCRIL